MNVEIEKCEKFGYLVSEKTDYRNSCEHIIAANTLDDLVKHLKNYIEETFRNTAKTKNN